LIYLRIRRLPPMIVAHWPMDLGAVIMTLTLRWPYLVFEVAKMMIAPSAPNTNAGVQRCRGRVLWRLLREPAFGNACGLLLASLPSDPCCIGMICIVCNYLPVFDACR
jgi:hypothetical protein